MLERAVADAVTITLQSKGVYRTRSAKTPAGTFYTTTVDSCTCPATAHCKHIARVRAEEERMAEYWAGVRESRRQSAAGRTIMAEVEREHGAWRTVTGNGRIGRRATFHRDPGSNE
jgi:hypothetical protein